jgi:hypothetical protein
MDGNFSEEGIINTSYPESRKNARKFWLLTYYDDKLIKEKSTLKINNKLINFPHIANFVFQAEEDSEGYHIHMAIELDNSKSKPVKQFMENFPYSQIQYVTDIIAAREYCSKKFSRIPNHEPIFNGIGHSEKKKLIQLSNVERNINLIQDTDERVELTLTQIEKERRTEKNRTQKKKKKRAVMIKETKTMLKKQSIKRDGDIKKYEEQLVKEKEILKKMKEERANFEGPLKRLQLQCAKIEEDIGNKETEKKSSVDIKFRLDLDSNIKKAKVEIKNLQEKIEGHKCGIIGKDIEIDSTNIQILNIIRKIKRSKETDLITPPSSPNSSESKNSGDIEETIDLDTNGEWGLSSYSPTKKKLFPDRKPLYFNMKKLASSNNKKKTNTKEEKETPSKCEECKMWEEYNTNLIRENNTLKREKREGNRTPDEKDKVLEKLRKENTNLKNKIEDMNNLKKEEDKRVAAKIKELTDKLKIQDEDSEND